MVGGGGIRVQATSSVIESSKLAIFAQLTGIKIEMYCRSSDMS